MTDLGTEAGQARIDIVQAKTSKDQPRTAIEQSFRASKLQLPAII